MRLEGLVVRVLLEVGVVVPVIKLSRMDAFRLTFKSDMDQTEVYINQSFYKLP